MLRPPPLVKKEEQCGVGCVHPKALQKCANINLFAALMCCVIGVQGLYLGYMVAVLTSIERRFEISSSQSGVMLAMYDIGHTMTVLFVGYFGSNRHKPRWTATGVIISAIAMFALALPNFIYGVTSDEEKALFSHKQYVESTICDRNRRYGTNSTNPECHTHKHHNGPYIILMFAQIWAGIAAAPFNTLAYVYVDDNVTARQSPFYLGLLTSMYAFGPALGFGLGALCNMIYADPRSGKVPIGLTPESPNWIGAWWLGFIICGFLYLICGLFLFLFPKKIPRRLDQRLDEFELERLKQGYYQEQSEEDVQCSIKVLEMAKEMPSEIWRLLKNPVYVSMVLGWIFGSYLVGGYGTYLPKYIETQFGQTASFADLYAGLISIGSVATSTAVGGYLLARLNIGPRTATLCLICSWAVILVTYFFGMGTGCEQPRLESKHVDYTKWNFTTTCNAQCMCGSVAQFDPVCVHNSTYFSPCHAGCGYNFTGQQWVNCRCAHGLDASLNGFCPMQNCWHLPIYVSIMFVGLFVGNLFFMVTMMIVLRCVYDEQKALALSFASCITNILGFIPSPIIFGAIIDSTCITWHSLCANDKGNCILYNNSDFKHKYHIGNAGFQFAAILVVTFTYIKSRSFTFPEEEIEAQSREYEGNLDSP